MTQALRPGEVGEMSAKKRPDGTWRARARYAPMDGAVRHTSAVGPTRAAALEALRRRVASLLAEPELTNVTPKTVAEVSEEWWTRYLRHEPPVGTITTYSSVLKNHVQTYFGDLVVSAVTVREVDQRMIRWEEETGLKSKTLRVLLSHVFTYAIQQGLMDQDPMPLITKMPAKRWRDPSLKRALTDAELARLRSAIEVWGRAHHFRDPGTLSDIVDLFLGTGLRIGELLALRPIDVTGVDPPGALTLEVSGTVQDAPGRGVIRQPHPKSSESARVIHLPEALRPMLERRFAEAPTHLAPLFPTATGRWRSRGNVRRALRAVLEDSDLEWVTPRSFRQTVATRIERSAGLQAASRQLGHRSEKTTRTHYVERAPLAPDNTGVLDGLIGGGDA